MYFPYRCICGYETEREWPFGSPVPESWNIGQHPAGPPGTSRTLCDGELHRVYETPLVNLGYRPTKHSGNEHWSFAHEA